MFVLKGLVLFLLMFLSWIASAKSLEFEKQCGEYKYIITIDNAETSYEEKIKHYYQKRETQRKLFHESEEGMFVTASCTKNKNNSDVFIFTEICGGSGCFDDIYGLFDLKEKKMLLKPSDWPKGNFEEVVKILGKPDFFLFHQRYHFKNHEFCCAKKLADYRYEIEQTHNTKEAS